MHDDTWEYEFDERGEVYPDGADRSAGGAASAAPSAPGLGAVQEDLRRLREELRRLREAQEPAAPAQPRPDHRADTPQPVSSELSAVRSGRRRMLKWLPVLVLLALAGVAAPRALRYLHSYESTDDAQIDGHIIDVSSRVSGTVSRVYVENTQFVKAGQLLAEIDSRDYDVAVDKARADLAQAQAQVRSARQDHEAALANVQQSEATNVKAQKDVQRYSVLYQTAVVSRGEYETQTRDARIAGAAMQSEKARAEGAERMIAVREAAVRSAQAALDQALLNAGYTRIVAAASGVVGKKTVEAGQHVDPGQGLLALVPLDDLWVTANFKETQLQRMRPGEAVTIHVDATGTDYRGYVDGMPAASGEKYSLLPPENATGKYVKVVQRLPVRIRFAPGQDQEHRLRPGMSVEPSVWLQ
jgi:membrane fusion protein, multidrug efflux system